MATRENYHHGDLRAALVAEGLRQLESGGDAISLRGLAKAAGVSPNAPYRHFADRHALMGSLAAEGFRRFTDAIVDAGRGQEPLAALASFGLAYLGFAHRNPALYRLMFSAYGYSLDHEECRRAAERAFAALMAVVAGAHGAGWRPGHAVQTLALSYWSTLHGWASLSGDGLMPPGVGETDRKALLASFIG